MQYMQGSSSAYLLPQTDEQQVCKMFIQMKQSLQQRLAVLYKTERYVSEQYHQTLKKYRKIVVGEISIETERYGFERLMLHQLAKAPSFTKQMKGYEFYQIRMLTEFCFNAVERLAPHMEFRVERHYANIPRLLEMYLHASGSDLAKKLSDMRANGLVFRVNCLVNKTELYVGLLKILLEHIHRIFIEKLTYTSRRIDAMIESANRSQMLLENTSKSFYFNIRKMKTDPSQQLCKQKPSPYLQQLKRVSNILPMLIEAQSSNFGKALFQSRKMSLNQTQSKILQGSMTQVQIPLKVRNIMKMKLKQDLSITMMNRTNIMKPNQECAMPQTTQKKKLPSIRIVSKSPSLKHYDESSKFISKDKLKEISSTHQVRQASSLSPVKTAQNIASINTTTTRFNNIYYEFLDTYHGNLKNLYKLTNIDDLQYEWFSNRRNRILEKDKADWLNKNLLKVVQHLTNKNFCVARALEQHACKYESLKGKQVVPNTKKKTTIFRCS